MILRSGVAVVYVCESLQGADWVKGAHWVPFFASPWRDAAWKEARRTRGAFPTEKIRTRLYVPR